MFYYSATIFKNAGLSEKSSQYANLGAGFINFVVSIIAIPLVNNCGRRILTIISLFGAGICLATLGTVIYVIVSTFLKLLIFHLYVVGSLNLD